MRIELEGAATDGWALLFATALGVVLVCGSRPSSTSQVAVVAPRIAVVPLDLAPHASGDVVVPPVHPDARPWPHGMVITPPATFDPINLLRPSAQNALIAAVGAAIGSLLSETSTPTSLGAPVR